MAIRFAIDGDLRFISHHDTMRLFERALSRASLPVRYSEGFNPRPRMSLPLPRAVGIASDAEVLVVDLDEPIEPAAVAAVLAPQVPEAIRILDAWVLGEGRSLQAERVEYRVAVPPESTQAALDAIGRLLASETLVVERAGAPGRRPRPVDVRSYILHVALEEGVLRWIARVGNDGTIRPGEMLKGIGLSSEDLHHKVRRTSVRWQTGQSPAGEPVISGP